MLELLFDVVLGLPWSLQRALFAREAVYPCRVIQFRRAATEL
jgi:hypothetical protein